MLFFYTVNVNVVCCSQFSPHLWPHFHFTLGHCELHKSRTTFCWRKFFVLRWSFTIKLQLAASSIDSRKMLKLLTVICRQHCELFRHAYSGYIVWKICYQVVGYHLALRCLQMWSECLVCDWFLHYLPTSTTTNHHRKKKIHYILCLKDDKHFFKDFADSILKDDWLNNHRYLSANGNFSFCITQCWRCIQLRS